MASRRSISVPAVILDSIIAAIGKDIEIQWVDVSGAVGRTTSGGNPQTGTGAGITAGSADSNFLVQYAVIHGNGTAGILSAKGLILNSEFYDNTRQAAFLGYNGAAVKGRTEYQAAYNYVHDEQGNGLWCSVGCVNDPARGEKGFWAHHNLTVDNGRSGIRSETSPNGLGPGVHSSEPNAVIEDNVLNGNSYGATRGAISVRDSQNVLIRNNVFGANAYKPGAVRVSDSGKSSRTDLWNVEIVGNVLNGERMVGCELPDNVVDCPGYN